MNSKYGRLSTYDVGEDFFDAEGFIEECEIAESEDMEFHEDRLKLALDAESTTEEERRFILNMLVRHVSTSGEPTISFVTSHDVKRFSTPSTKYYYDFSPVRSPFSEVFERYLDGSLKETKKTKKTDLSRFGHLDHSASQNLSRALSPTGDRDATFEFMAICCLYFKIEPFFATVLFHRCIGVDELSSYPYIGAALWLFLEDECYDYEFICQNML